MGAIGVIVKILQVPAIANVVQQVTSKILSRKGKPNQGIDPKVSAFSLPVLIAEIVVVAAKAFNPELGALLEANRATIVEFAVLLGAVFAYFTPNAASPPAG